MSANDDAPQLTLEDETDEKAEVVVRIKPIMRDLSDAYHWTITAITTWISGELRLGRLGPVSMSTNVKPDRGLSCSGS